MPCYCGVSIFLLICVVLHCMLVQTKSSLSNNDGKMPWPPPRSHNFLDKGHTHAKHNEMWNFTTKMDLYNSMPQNTMAHGSKSRERGICYS